MPAINPYLTPPVGSIPMRRQSNAPEIPYGARRVKPRTLEDMANISRNSLTPQSRMIGPAPAPTVTKIPTAPKQYITTRRNTGSTNPYTQTSGWTETRSINPEWTKWNEQYGTSASSTTTATPSNSQNLTTEYQKAFDEAKASNEKRYGDISTQYGTQRADYERRLATGMGFLDNAGLQQSKDIVANWEAQKGKGVQNLVDAGFYNSTVKPTMEMGYESQKQADLARLNESLNQQRLQTYGQLSGDVLNSNQRFLNFQENRTDAYPDASMYAQLMQQAGQSGSGALGSAPVVTGGGTFASTRGKGTTVSIPQKPFVGDVERLRQYRNSPKVKTTITPAKKTYYSAPTKAAPKAKYVPMVDKSFRGNKKYYAELPGTNLTAFKIY